MICSSKNCHWVWLCTPWEWNPAISVGVLMTTKNVHLNDVHICNTVYVALFLSSFSVNLNFLFFDVTVCCWIRAQCLQAYAHLYVMSPSNSRSCTASQIERIALFIKWTNRGWKVTVCVSVNANTHLSLLGKLLAFLQIYVVHYIAVVPCSACYEEWRCPLVAKWPMQRASLRGVVSNSWLQIVPRHCSLHPAYSSHLAFLQIACKMCSFKLFWTKKLFVCSIQT